MCFSSLYCRYKGNRPVFVLQRNAGHLVIDINVATRVLEHEHQIKETQGIVHDNKDEKKKQCRKDLKAIKYKL